MLGKQIQTIDDLEGSGIAHIRDWPKSEIAACLFGGHELSGRLFTKTHEFVIIDSELMFASGPCSFENTMWFMNEGESQRGAIEVAYEVCSELVALGQQLLGAALILPSGLEIGER